MIEKYHSWCKIFPYVGYSFSCAVLLVHVHSLWIKKVKLNFKIQQNVYETIYTCAHERRWLLMHSACTYFRINWTCLDNLNFPSSRNRDNGQKSVIIGIGVENKVISLIIT